MSDNNKHKNRHWMHQWDNINFELYARVRLTRAYPNENPLGVTINEKHLVKIMKSRFNLDSDNL